MAHIRVFNPEGTGVPVGPFSQVATVSASSGLAFISGQVGAESDGTLIGIGDFQAQVWKAFDNLATVLDSLGLSMTDVAYTRGFLVRPEDLPAYRQARIDWYAQVTPDGPPPCSTVVVRSLYVPECLFEMDAVAVFPEGKGA